MTDITEHPTRRRGKVYCSVVLDAFSRRVVGWSIDSRPRDARDEHDRLCPWTLSRQDRRAREENGTQGERP